MSTNPTHTHTHIYTPIHTRYVEEGPVAALFRQSPLNAIWEGSGNVICLDVLRAFAREPASRRVFLAELHRHKLMHRVIKPENVCLTEGWRECKLIGKPLAFKPAPLKGTLVLIGAVCSNPSCVQTSGWRRRRRRPR